MNDILTRDIDNKDDFKAYTDYVESLPGYRRPIGFGIFKSQFGQLHADRVITGRYLASSWGNNFGSAALFQQAAQLTDGQANGKAEVILPMTPEIAHEIQRVFKPFQAEATGSAHANVRVANGMSKLEDLSAYSMVMLYEDQVVESLQAAYLKLYALSYRRARPNTLNVDKIFGVLDNVAWSGKDAFELEWLKENKMDLEFDDAYPTIDFIDKFPRYTHHVASEMSVRIASGHTVRLGAHLEPGTTVMPGAAYINFNAGTVDTRSEEARKKDPSQFMVEGRISSAATIGYGTDVGGGASIMGVLSGGNKEPVTIGERNLLGANSVTGLSIGNACVVDAGITILRGTKFSIEDEQRDIIAQSNPESIFAKEWEKVKKSPRLYKKKPESYKGRALQGLNGLHFRQDSLTGRMIVTRSDRPIELNAQLHM